MLRSSAGAEWVSAPTEMKSTPVSAISRTFVEVDRRPRPRAPAPSPARRAARHRRAQLARAHVVEQQAVGAGLERLARPRRGRGTRPRPAVPALRPRARAATASPTPPASATWFSLIRIASWRPMRWLVPPPAATAAFSSARSPGVVLRVSRIRAPVPLDRLDEAGGQRGDAGEVAEEVERRALGGQQRPRRARPTPRRRPAPRRATRPSATSPRAPRRPPGGTSPRRPRGRRGRRAASG